MSKSHNRGVTFTKQARQMIFHVYSYMKAESEANNLKLSVKKLKFNVSKATNASQSTVERVICEARRNSLNFVTPGKRRKRQNAVLTFSLLELGRIKRLIHNFHVQENEMVTTEKLVRKLAETMNYKGSAGSLRRTLIALGFKAKNFQGGGGRRLFLEKSEIRLQRIEYLQTLRNNREEGKNIVYAHHAFVEPNYSAQQIMAKKCIVKTYMGVFTATANDAYIPEATYVYGTSKDGYDDQFYQNYEKWIKEYLIPHLPENSLVIISSEKYHNKDYETLPNSYASRSELIGWLQSNQVYYQEDWLKPQLYSLIKTHAGQKREFLIDKLLSDQNHSVLRIPIYHPDLNPSEIAWEDVKSHLKSQKLQFTITNISEAVNEKIETMTGEFKSLCKKIEDIEEEYMKSDYVIDMLTEEFKFYAGESSGQEEDDDDEFSDSEAEESEEEVEVKKERIE